MGGILWYLFGLSVGLLIYFTLYEYYYISMTMCLLALVEIKFRFVYRILKFTHANACYIKQARLRRRNYRTFRDRAKTGQVQDFKAENRELVKARGYGEDT